MVKENGFYTDVIPALQQLQIDLKVPDEKQLDIFVKCFGARLSLDSSKREADADALLVLENLKFLGFESEDRQTGFTTACAMLILEKLAQFHALGIAFRFSRPEVFDKTICPFLEKINLDDNDVPESISQVSELLLAKANRVQKFKILLVSEHLQSLGSNREF